MCPGTRSRGKSFRFSVTITPVPPTTAAATTCSSSGSGSENVPSSGSQPVTIASPEVLAHRPDQPRTSRLGLRRKVLAPFELGGLMELWARRESPPPTTDDTNPRPPSTAGNPAAGSARGQSGQSIDHPPTLSAHAAGAPSLRDRFCALNYSAPTAGSSSSSICTPVCASASYWRAGRCCCYSSTSRSNSRCRLPTADAGCRPSPPATPPHRSTGAPSAGSPPADPRPAASSTSSPEAPPSPHDRTPARPPPV